jgi:predicted ArsR family transcriptional regulator
MEQEHSDVAHDDAEYIEAVRDADPATTNAIGEAVGVTRQAADYRLRQLADEGKVEAEMIGNTLIWSIAE